MNEVKTPYSYADHQRNGIYHVPVKNDGSVYLAEIHLSELFTVVGIATDGDGTRHHVISYRKNEHCIIACGDVGTNEGWRKLRNVVKIPSKKQKLDLLTEYIQNHESEEEWRITDVAGWQGDNYILPNGEIVGTDERLYFNGRISREKRSSYQSAGTIEEWKNRIGRYAAGNSRLCLMLGAAFAAPLLRLLHVDGGVLHLYGQSSSGKTTAQRVALSVWGHGRDSGESWNSTAYALVNNAAARNDGLLALDEMGEDATGRSVDQSIYTLANGKGRALGAKEGGNRPEVHFRVLVVSSGETSLEGHMSKHGRQVMAGQMVRCPSIPHLLEHHHDFDDFQSFTQHLNTAVCTSYGSVGREYMRRLAQDKSQLEVQLQQRFRNHLESLRQSSYLSDQAARTARLFAACMVGLEFACEWGLTGFASDEGIQSITRCFGDWSDNQPGKMPLEEAQILRTAMDYIQTSDLFFVNPNQPPSYLTLPFPGYVKRAAYETEEDMYYVFPKTFSEHIVKGHDEEKVKEVLHRAGWLQKNSDNRWQQQLCGREKQGGKVKRLGRFYVFRGIAPPEENGTIFY